MWFYCTFPFSTDFSPSKSFRLLSSFFYRLFSNPHLLASLCKKFLPSFFSPPNTIHIHSTDVFSCSLSSWILLRNAHSSFLPLLNLFPLLNFFPFLECTSWLTSFLVFPLFFLHSFLQLTRHTFHRRQHRYFHIIIQRHHRTR